MLLEMKSFLGSVGEGMRVTISRETLYSRPGL